MRKRFHLVAAGAIALCGPLAVTQLAANSQDQSTGSQSRQSTEPARNTETTVLPAGTGLNVELEKTVDSKDVKPGDTVEARMTKDVKLDDRVVIPEGSKVIGRVTQATAKEKGDNESTLAIEFDRVELKNEGKMAIRTNIQDMAPARSAGTPPNVQGAAGVPAGTNRDRDASGAQPDNSADRARQGMADNESDSGLKGLKLESSTDGSKPALFSSTKKSVQLRAGTRLLLVTQPPLAAKAQ